MWYKNINIIILGLNKVESNYDFTKFINYDFSSLIGGHLKYESVFSTILT